ncbi:hypothetical protein F0L74_04620 [Chitinophaga agrisoli]|uniref:DUF4199 domain-containing protein n=1 Tax=Chitinophaga agrisoli TaxID=2607653 RepID=A0A5B2W0P7_9BACT|nr:hypothetical protein [Chitinophaga agrisoli]KAA2245251.1 hypothetical protein F0L74_04620 [Chitinophaga agrisoli]
MATIHHHHPVKVGFWYSIVISIISLVLTVIFYVSNVYAALWTGYFVNLVLFLGVLFAIWHYNRQHHDHVTQRELFSVGLRITLVVTVVLTVFSLIFHFIIQANPPSGSLMNEGGSPQGVDMPRNFWVFLISNVFFSNGIVGLLAALMGSMYFKRNQKTAGED